MGLACLKTDACMQMYSDVADIQRRNLSAMITAMDTAAKNVTEVPTHGLAVRLVTRAVGRLSKPPACGRILSLSSPQVSQPCWLYIDTSTHTTVLFIDNGGPVNDKASNYPLKVCPVSHILAAPSSCCSHACREAKASSGKP